MRVTATKDLAALKAAAQQKIDTEAEAARLKYVTAGSVQAMVYQEKYAQAKACVADPAGSYPLLDATVGVEGDTVMDVANLVIAQATQWMQLAAVIERLRLTAKRAVETASTPAAITAATQIMWP